VIILLLQEVKPDLSVRCDRLIW